MRTSERMAMALVVAASLALEPKVAEPGPFHQPWQKRTRGHHGATKGTIAQRKAKRERRKNSR